MEIEPSDVAKNVHVLFYRCLFLGHHDTVLKVILMLHGGIV